MNNDTVMLKTEIYTSIFHGYCEIYISRVKELLSPFFFDFSLNMMTHIKRIKVDCSFEVSLLQVR